MHYTLYNSHFILNITNDTPHNSHLTVNIMPYTLQISHFTPNITNYTPHKGKEIYSDFT